MSRTTNAFRGEVVAGRLVTVPPILVGRETPAVRKTVDRFYHAVDELFERWVARRDSHHTQRSYRGDVMAFVQYLGIPWPRGAEEIFTVSVADVLAWREHMVDERHYAPKTVSRRISSVSSLYKYLQAVAGELRLPITVPNPAHAQFIARAATDPVQETHALTATRARQIMGLPAGDDVIARRDRAIIRFYLYSGARIGTGCRLKVSDFKNEDEEATVRLTMKGDRRRTIGLHFNAAQAISEYVEAAGLTSGPLFRPRRGPHSFRLAERPISTIAMYKMLLRYLKRLPGATKTGENGKEYCVYSPHSLRATTATLLLDAGVDIRKVQELLGHRHVTTTQIYDKRRRTAKESASHDVPI